MRPEKTGAGAVHADGGGPVAAHADGTDGGCVDHRTLAHHKAQGGSEAAPLALWLRAVSAAKRALPFTSIRVASSSR